MTNETSRPEAANPSGVVPVRFSAADRDSASTPVVSETVGQDVERSPFRVAVQARRAG
ncbi:hypothetical protein B0I33_11178 [Prauserella shujinwangii]|uniref:Uncharacterized protein n=1 Tax=Prauserella shujinwangii TaxID=1453103 RepID=A0A2T0LN34_9PSEU|nr:hypothetical protein [Prauserella shujinwangii]PRX44569.1 hypothetical protein B0I33_11178 [Prauserella shujinwangii]